MSASFSPAEADLMKASLARDFGVPVRWIETRSRFTAESAKFGTETLRADGVDHASAVGACHCEMCRRWGGGPFMEIGCDTDTVFTGDENIRVFDSSAWAERGFCKKCGSHLFYRIKDTGRYAVPVGLLYDQTGLTFESQVFVDERPDYYDFANDTEKLTGAECFAKYAP